MGGSGTSVEIYSPTGNCNHKLSDLPIASDLPVLVYVKKMIIACSGGKSCWEYKVKENNWSMVATAPFTHNYQPGVVFQEKVYVIDESNPQMFDPSSKTWSSWPSPPKKTGGAPTMVGWKDCILLLGGNSNRRGVQIFNVSEQTWTVMDSSQVLMDLQWSSSLTLVNENLFIVGAYSDGFYNSAVFYNPTDNSWVKLQDSVTDHLGTRLVLLGSRIFAIDGFQTDLVEEFMLETNTWKPVDIELLIKRTGHHSVLALPAILFSHLQGGCQGVN